MVNTNRMERVGVKGHFAAKSRYIWWAAQKHVCTPRTYYQPQIGVTQARPSGATQQKAIHSSAHKGGARNFYINCPGRGLVA